MSGLSIVANSDNTGHTTSEYIEAATNTAGELTPIAKFSPDPGMFLKLKNQVPQGEKVGIPLYAKFKDSAGNLLPTNTELAIGVKPLGENHRMLVSDKIDNISYWNQNSITTQRDSENVDAVKIPLDYPTGVNKEGRPNAINVNGVDEAYLLANSASQWDPNYSEVYFESGAVSTGRNR